MGMKCLIDLDGVLVDFARGVFDFRGVPEPEVIEWDFIKPSEWPKFDRSFWANLYPTWFAWELLTAAQNAFGVSNICILTSPCITDGCVDGKMDWVRTRMPLYKRQILVGAAKEFCAHSDALLIDDLEDNVQKFRGHGGNAILVPAKWNRHRKIEPLPYVVEEINNYANPDRTKEAHHEFLRHV